MSDGEAVDAPVFTPSEMVVLFGDRFAPEAGMLVPSEVVLTSRAKVSSGALMGAAVKAALYTVHRSGAARLQLQEGTAMFGLRKTHNVALLQGLGTAEFPAGSLEAFLLESAVMEREVEDVLKSFIGEEVSNPAQRVLGLIKRGLSERGMLEAEMRKTMLVFTTIDYVLPPDTRLAAEAQPVLPVQQLLRHYAQREPELDAALQKEIDSACAHMTSSDD